MAIHPRGLLRARIKAPFHVQAELLKSQIQVKPDSFVEIQGRVVRVFRRDRRLKLGDHISFRLFVRRSGRPPLTGVAPVEENEFMKATHIEAYLDGSPPKCRLTYEFTLLNGPTKRPKMTVALFVLKNWWRLWA